jgi:hypothetical protein
MPDAPGDGRVLQFCKESSNGRGGGTGGHGAIRKYRCPERCPRSGILCAEAGQGTAAPCPAPPSSPVAAHLRFDPDAVDSLDEGEHFTAPSSCQRRYAPMVFGVIPECCSASPELAFSFAGIPARRPRGRGAQTTGIRRLPSRRIDAGRIRHPGQRGT